MIRLLGLAVVVGCVGPAGPGGKRGPAGVDGLATLVQVEDEPAGTNCADGGVAVNTGVDADGNGVLDAAEVDSTSYVCSGAAGETGAAGSDGAEALVSLSVEPAGTHCAEGGILVESGVDLDGNGALDAGEVTSTVYVCNGSTGAPGSVGTTALVRLEAEPAGSNCEAGGTAIHSGLDVDGNGVLDNGEILTTSYACDAVGPPPTTRVEGTFLVRNSLDAAAIQQATEITGDLWIDAPGLTELSLPVLQTIGGNLRITTESDELTSARFPVLRTVGGSVDVSAADGLATLDLGVLTTIGNDLRLQAFPGDDVRGLQDLTAIGQNVEIGGLVNTTSLDIGAGSPVGHVHIEGNPSLVSLSGTVGLVDIRQLVVVDNPALTQLDLTGLRTVANVVHMENNPMLAVSGGANLTSLGDLVLWDTPATGLDLSALTTLDRLTLDNTALTRFAPAGLTGLSEATVRGNALLTDLDLGAASYPPVAVDVRDNALLATLDLGGLENADLAVEDNAALQSVSLDGLRETTSVAFRRNGGSFTLAFPDLGTAESLWFEDNTGLVSLAFDGRASTTRWLYVNRNAGLRTFSGDLQGGSSLEFDGNPDLQSITFDYSSSYGYIGSDLMVSQSPSLHTLQVLDSRLVYGVYVIDAPLLTTLALPDTTGASHVWLQSTGVVELSGLAALITLGELTLDGNPDLIALDGMASLVDVPYAYVTNHPVLCESHVETFLGPLSIFFANTGNAAC